MKLGRLQPPIWGTLLSRALAVAGLILGPAIVLAVVSCSGPKTPALPKPISAVPEVHVVDVRAENRTLTEEETLHYAGNASCIQCHEKLSKSHAVSGHANTLKVVTAKTHGDIFRTNQKIKDADLQCTYSLEVKDGKCYQVNKGPWGVKRNQVDLAIGSGINGQTYLSHAATGVWIDLRLSYYSRVKQWEFTPQQSPGEQTLTNPPGALFNPEQVVNCLRCHVLYQVAGQDGPDLKHTVLGVGCERCHGPARAHVDTARRKLDGETIPLVHLENLKLASPQRIHEICGACHSTESDPRIGDPKTEAGIARFEVTALERSKCFKSSGTLSCLTCHDSHTNAKTGASSYDAVCFRCHSGGPATVAGPKRSACKANQTKECARCHMPADSIASLRHATWHHHWIKIWPKKMERPAEKY